MAEDEQTQQQEKQNGHDNRRTVVRAAALAAASGATALAAKKALSHDSRSEPGSEGKRRDSRSGDGSVVSSMVSSAWGSARESLVPMIEDAAGQAGEYLAKNGPELVRENIVPRFIRGFERGRESENG
jgi:hypothetical protein